MQAKPGPRSLRSRALCVAPDAEVAEVGASVLHWGGNAFDAAVAAGFMESVVAPHNCGIGGYAAVGIAFHADSGKVVVLDANAVAPRAATSTMFPVLEADEPGDYRFANKDHKQGPLSVAVPGVLAGLLLMLERWGTLDRAGVLTPAIKRAREGVKLTPGRALTWLTLKAEAEGKAPPERSEVPAVVPMPELANILEAIEADGAAVFYRGKISRAIVDHVRKLGGVLTPEDMAAYRAQVVEPVTIEVRGHMLATPPPAAGGLTSLQAVALFDRLERRSKTGGPGSADAFGALLEVQKVVWEERLTRLGDPTVMGTPPGDLLTEAYIEELLRRCLEGLAHPQRGRIIAPDPLRGTVHLATADEAGNMVAWTQTHGGLFGSGVMVPGTEIVLGHGMCRFEPRPGWVNSIRPGKRPLHNMSPTLALRDGRPVLAVGASGGRTIVNNVATVLIRRLVHGLDPLQALASPRIQCETIEPAVLEAAAGSDCFAALREQGHDVKEANRDAGTAHLIARDRDAWVGVPEPRAAEAEVAAG
jgi:gamma-glutamyltranspeptidase/glutathione hydrolase